MNTYATTTTGEQLLFLSFLSLSLFILLGIYESVSVLYQSMVDDDCGFDIHPPPPHHHHFHQIERGMNKRITWTHIYLRSQCVAKPEQYIYACRWGRVWTGTTPK